MGSYRRRLPVSLERMYENALDWQHLPHLHRSSFCSISCESSGGWGWRAETQSGTGDKLTSSLVELRLDRDARRWITSNLAGPNAGVEIWTHAIEVSTRVLDIVVDFFVPNVPETAKAKVGMAYAKAYEVLYDEDVVMMTERQRQLDRRVDGVDESQVLELDSSVAQSLPLTIEMSGRRFTLNRLDALSPEEQGAWVVYPVQCPHQLGPLSDVPLVNGTVRCPWHGYIFDVVTGECLSGGHCRLGRAPKVTEERGKVTLRWV